MPSKKKPKPSFNVPEELQEAPQAGWVYRSDSDSTSAEKPQTEAVSATPPVKEPTTPEKVTAPPVAAARVAGSEEKSSQDKKKKSTDSGKSKSSSNSESSLIDLASKTISSGFETVGNAMLLATRILIAPISMGMRIIGLKSK